MDRPIRVLLVDDEEDLVRHLSLRLQARGCSPFSTTNGYDALAAAEGTTFDVAVVDLRMPGLDGLQTLEGLKRIQPFVQVILLTGHGRGDGVLDRSHDDTYRYLEKPCELEHLLKEIRDARDRRRAAQNAAFQRDVAVLTKVGQSDHERMAATARLKEKYEQQ